MKILMLCDFYNEGLEYQENLLVKFYVKHGHAVTVVTSTYESVFDYYADRHDNTQPSRTFEHGGAKIVKLRYRYNVVNRLRAFERIDRLLESEAPDLIFVHDIMLNLPECVRYVRRHPACRMIMDYHADYSNSGKNALSRRILHGVCRKWFLDRARPHLSRIFPVVPASMTFLHEIYKVPLADMEILPLGADTDLAAAVRRSGARAELRRSLGVGDRDTVIFTGGKLDPAKRTDLLLKAVLQLQPLPLHVVVAGDSGDEHAWYKQELRRLAAAEPRVHMVGWLGRDDIYRYLDMADLAVFPASQSILWQQAIAMGLPLIVGDIGHQDISYLNMEDNIVILGKDEIRADRLADAISRVVGDPGRMRAMSDGARRVADLHLNWDRLIQRTLRFNDVSPTRSESAQCP
jgi:glycosyltransferase involved in cell wall biosynthesis